jgi:NAD+ kinase
MDESPHPIRQIGVVVHPTRRLERVLAEIGAWASAHGVALGQIALSGQTRRVADPVEAAACDLLLALGGDGTALAALHAGAPSSRPVLGVACGSVGVLMSVPAHRLPWALEEVAAGRWTPIGVPGLDVGWDAAPGAVAINDLVVIRDGPGQVLVSVTVDDALYARVAGDGLVVATPLGSSAYTMAGGGPILAPGAEGMAVTPLAPHGGVCPPLVAGIGSRLTLTVEPGHGGVRHEIDGRRAAIAGGLLTIGWRPDYATLVRLTEGEPRLTGLRRRGLVLDSPRALIRGGRSPQDAEAGGSRSARPTEGGDATRPRSLSDN